MKVEDIKTLNIQQKKILARIIKENYRYQSFLKHKYINLRGFSSDSPLFNNQKVILLFYEFLEQNHALEAYKNYCKMNLKLIPCKSFITLPFRWSQTKEGETFWLTLSVKWVDYIHNKFINYFKLLTIKYETFK